MEARIMRSSPSVSIRALEQGVAINHRDAARRILEGAYFQACIADAAGP
ncbi:MAG TPA: hypothetical protein VKB80_31115 [Kofleriaceae bacterium]|nr:hypothetical protein [Kofleriaceae bacterium]